MGSSYTRRRWTTVAAVSVAAAVAGIAPAVPSAPNPFSAPASFAAETSDNPIVSGGTTIVNGPQTPLTDSKLPIVTTNRSGALKANTLNPRPVCNPWQEYRTVIYKVKNSYSPVGTLMFTNNNDSAMDVTQNIGRSKSFTLDIKGDIGGDFMGKGSISLGASYTESWQQGQSLVQRVEPHQTNYVSYGFNTVSFEGTQQSCKLDGTWSDPWPLYGQAPTALAVRTIQSEDNSSALPTITGDTGSNLGQPVSVPEPPTVTSDVADAKQHLALSYQTSALKAPGYTGVVDIKAKNTGSQRYYNFDQPAMFLVQVHTEEGPEGVDRLMNFRPRSGATVIDYGFDETNSVHSYLVSLSNPVYAGSTANLGSLWFGDGNTREGRLVNSVTTTLLNPNGNVSEDESEVQPDWTSDNTRVVSTEGTTVTDFGRPNDGLF